jgi:hypothetical protein
MTQQEYEQQYSDAVASLRRRGNQVGKPYYSHDGVRAVRIVFTETVVRDILLRLDTFCALAGPSPSYQEDRAGTEVCRP